METRGIVRKRRVIPIPPTSPLPATRGSLFPGRARPSIFWRETLKKIITLCVFLSFLTLPPLAQAGTLRLLTWNGYAPEALIQKFEEEFKTQVHVTVSNNEEMIGMLIASGGGGFDLVQPSQDRVISGQEAGKIYQPMDYSRIDESLFIPSMLENVKKNTQIDGKSYGVPFCWGTSALIVNKKYAPQASSFKDLFDPAYKGRISYRLQRPILIGTAFALGYNPFELYGDEKAYRNMLDKVAQKLIENKSLLAGYWASSKELLEAMSTEKVVLAKGWDNDAFKLHAQNPDLDFVAPETGALGWIDTFVLAAGAENVEAAYNWINFVMRPENAALFTNAEKIPTASKDAGAFLDPAVKDNFDRCLPPEVIDNIKWYPPLPSRLESLELTTLDVIRAK